MQKLEDEPAIEFHNMLRAADGLREKESSADRLTAWQAGRTGYPLVDACMRSLEATGWLTFRMRAMVVSFASYSLWLHWRPTGLHLARHFLDFEPGIHWSQLQMQSGTTGINTLRIYSPTKQALDQDPQGLYINFYGSSFITDAQGAKLAEAPEDADAVLLAELDLQACARLRDNWFVFRDRRPELYGSLLTFDGDGTA
jgi:deoxyribodipyrimidine photo-lyase